MDFYFYVKLEKMKATLPLENIKNNSTNFPQIQRKQSISNNSSFASSSLFKNKKTNEIYKVRKNLELEGGYLPFKNKDFHLHPHLNKEKPHIHSLGCDPFVSGYDLQRETRYYFTNDKTPVRCYIKYDHNKNKTNRLTISKTFTKEVSNMR